MVLIGGGVLITNDDGQAVIQNGAVAVNGGTIAAVGDTSKLRAEHPSAEYIDANGGVIMPGLINAHTHISRALARGFGLIDSFNSFDQYKRISEFEARLDFKACIASAYALLTDSILSGVTAIIDMFTGCSDPRGILFVLAGIAGELGIRAGLGMGVSAKDSDRFDLTCRENIEFIEYCDENRLEIVRPMFGLDAIYSMDNDALLKAAHALSGSAALHVSLSDGPDDTFYTKRLFGCTPVERLYEQGLITQNTLLSHCSCIAPHEAELIAKSGAYTVHTPASDLLKRDVSPDMGTLIGLGATVGLGTDGITNDVLTLPSAAVACLNAKDGCGFTDTSVDMLMRGNAKIASRVFNLETGVLRPGAAADLIVMSYKPFTDITPENYREHILMGIDGSLCMLNMVNGRILMRDRKLLTDPDKYRYKKTAAEARKLWAKTE